MTDYGDENPLLMDYYGFQPALYQLKFKSRGDSVLSKRVVELYKDVSSITDNVIAFRINLMVGRISCKDDLETRGARGRWERIQRSRL